MTSFPSGSHELLIWKLCTTLEFVLFSPVGTSEPSQNKTSYKLQYSRESNKNKLQLWSVRRSACRPERMVHCDLLAGRYPMEPQPGKWLMGVSRGLEHELGISLKAVHLLHERDASSSPFGN
ncbi:hypothetical protein B0J15DRAFT_230500 [Fusarium solani]|uniref:Uncharacterized protein n=1 Tax=Fusarium solani TaxID=169388 RepID=A0A9P9R6K6_FUSSL|nr:uncharacterized protein B0J15DRAFT_230500 [Fusarium solani]KAH7268341.1 hypothetical protein B0J15DRAFT_230500 [Fusarium solani]